MKLKRASKLVHDPRFAAVRVAKLTSRTATSLRLPSQATPVSLKPTRRATPVPAPKLAEVPRDSNVQVAGWEVTIDCPEMVTPLARYMRDAIAVPLLTVDQEVELARRIQLGDEAAREHMIRANLRLVVKIARQYENYGLPLLDLINEGNIGLIKAVERFDPAKGGKLSTYGVWWIKQSIRRALSNQSKTIRVPESTLEMILAIRRVTERYEMEMGRAPTATELGDETKLSVKRVVEIQSATLSPTSLDAKIGDADSKCLADLLPDSGQADPALDLAKRDLHALVEKLVHRLPERERVIIQSRFGLSGSRKLKYRTIGARFRVSRERIRQLQNQALQKLRRLIQDRESMPVAA